ncbi:MAG: hypothetical protein ITD40_03750 [Nitrosarchaeum sp.]|nr:hypothetical protein [Nitrosarchaeum sp.]
MKIGIYMMDIEKIDRETGAYDVIFWVTETSDDYNFLTQPPPIIDYENGYVDEISAVSIKEHFYKFKARGTFYNNIDYSSYPFHNMDLLIHIKSVIPNTLDNFQFVVEEDYSGIHDEKFVSVAGWNIAEPIFFISNQTYPWGEFSRYTAIFHLESSTSTIFLKYLSPVIIIALFAFATLWFPVISSDEKIEIIAATLIGAIFFHVAYLNAHVPDVAYLTLADKIMMSIYSIFAMCLLAVLLHKKHESKLQENYTKSKENALSIKFKIMIPIIAITIYLSTYLL